MALSSCPLGPVFFEVDNLWLYTGVEHFEFGAPYVSTDSRLHQQESLWAYQAVVHSAVERIQRARLEASLASSIPSSLWLAWFEKS